MPLGDPFDIEVTTTEVDLTKTSFRPIESNNRNHNDSVIPLDDTEFPLKLLSDCTNCKRSRSSRRGSTKRLLQLL